MTNKKGDILVNYMQYPTQQQFIEAINLIQQSVEGERGDAQFYQWLIDNVPSEGLTRAQRKEIVDIIKSIRDDEMGHNIVWKQMYREFTGREARPKEEEFEPPESFQEGIKKALFGESNAVRRYRQILSGLPNNYYRDKAFNILTDELRHADLYNFIYTNVLNLEDTETYC